MATTSERERGDEGKPSESKPRRAYVAPTFRFLGSVAQLTAGIGGSVSDGTTQQPSG